MMVVQLFGYLYDKSHQEVLEKRTVMISASRLIRKIIQST